MKLAIITAHAGADTLQECASSWGFTQVAKPLLGMTSADFDLTGKLPALYVVNGQQGMLPAYQAAFEICKADVLAFLHDDLIVKEPYQEVWSRVLDEFQDPQVGLLGFGGAKDHGDPQIYKIPYDYRQLGRSRFMSNMEDAEVHGQRFTGSTEVAVLDGFALIVRRELLEKAGGWPIGTPIGYVAYDYWLCCMAHRLGYEIRLVGVACKHYGGATFVKLGHGKSEAAWQQYVDAHRYIYDEFRDVLPWRCA